MNILTACFARFNRACRAAVLVSLLGVCAGHLNAQAGGEMIWDGEKWAPATAPQPGTPMGDLAIIRSNVEAGRTNNVVKQVETFLVTHPQSPGAEEAMNLAGQALMDEGHYWDAYDWYTRQTSTYPNGAFYQRALHRQYAIADAFLEGRKRRLWKIFRIDAKDDALDMLQRIAAAAPGTDIAERALLRAADHYFFDAKLYNDAIGLYEQFIRENPNSPRRAYAMLQVPKAYLLMFRGVEWDITPLLDAKKRFEIFAAAYPRAAEQENIATILEEIRHIRAHKLYNTGWFYERTKHPRAAAFYYRKLLTIENERGEPMFVDTEWAEQARIRLASLGPVEPEEPRETPANATRPPAAAHAATPDAATPPGVPARLSQEIRQPAPDAPTREPAPEPPSRLGPAPRGEDIINVDDLGEFEETEETPGPVPIEELPELNE